MIGDELTLIREASFSSPELSSNMQGCCNGQIVPRLDSPRPEFFHMGYRSECDGPTHTDRFPMLE